MAAYVGKIPVQGQQRQGQPHVARHRAGQLSARVVQRPLHQREPGGVIALGHLRPRPGQGKDLPVAVDVGGRGHLGLLLQKGQGLLPGAAGGLHRQGGAQQGTAQQNGQQSMEMFHKIPPKKQNRPVAEAPRREVCFKFRPKQVQRSCVSDLTAHRQYHSDRLAGLLTRFRVPQKRRERTYS